MTYGTLICPICGKEFTKTAYNQSICIEPECKMKAQRIRCYNLMKKNFVPKAPLEKICLVCGKKFETRYHQQVVCGDILCKEAYRKGNLRKEYRATKESENSILVTVMCICPRCGVKHEKESAPVNIVPRAYCEDCRDLAYRMSSGMMID